MLHTDGATGDFMVVSCIFSTLVLVSYYFTVLIIVISIKFVIITNKVKIIYTWSQVSGRSRIF